MDNRDRASEEAFKVNIEDEDFVMQLINNLVEVVEEDINKGLEDQVTFKRVHERIRVRFRSITIR